MRRKRFKDNNLKSRFPELAKQWHPKRNGDLRPEDVTFGSNRKVWWRCSKFKTHIWEAVVTNRTSGESDCPQCFGPSSKPELRILAETRFIFKNAVYQKTFKSSRFRVDIFLNDFNLAVEYDGSYWHEHHGKKDLKKKYISITIIFATLHRRIITQVLMIALLLPSIGMDLDFQDKFIELNLGLCHHSLIFPCHIP